MMHRWLVVLALLFVAKPAVAFCGFYVAGADTPMFAEASQVVLMRDGTRTVLSMQNDYKGPPKDFALVVPVPVVLQKENVKTLPREVFDHVEHLSAPRLVEYWERDPCSNGAEGVGLDRIGTLGTGQGFGNGHGRLGGAYQVKVEAEFAVGEYQIVILSAQDAAGLEAWLKDNGYKIPDGAEPYLRPYVQAGSKFFVAKVDVTKVKIEDGRARLSPLRVHYDSEKFDLPVRLGLVNSAGTQDLIVHILAPSKRYEVANYPNVTIPTNLDVAESARDRFAEVYAALYDRTVESNPKAVVTEYAWPSSSCDPCPGNQSGLSAVDIVTLGADVLPSISASGGVKGSAPSPVLRQDKTEVSGRLPPEVIQRIVRQNFGRFRLCYDNGLRSNPTLAGKVRVKFDIDRNGDVKSPADAGGSTLKDQGVVSCVVRGFGNLSFPQPEAGTVTVVYGIDFSPTGPPRGIPNNTPFVLTRLHARYGKDSLGADLVFKEAPAIVGGRETWENGTLEEGAKPATTNSFQARYAIRHPWKGPVACADPKRGIWGGPWPTVDAGATAPIEATNLAYAPRGKIDLSSILAAVPIAAAPDAGATPPPAAPAAPGAKASKCGCDVPGGSPADLSAFAAFAFAAAAIVRRLVCSRAR